ncbi:hypothetical protein FZEAL_10036 [Fusarium zealandicum]|uniref:Uncharacterized protein n=1 Tax=Fusarium zealandicum TaxID=1053134 RepID=A0A8H4U6H1_9HYPO|nr:hypothetical protein FZEAL_10036 [Fusarium zealandicum]
MVSNLLSRALRKVSKTLFNNGRIHSAPGTQTSGACVRCGGPADRCHNAYNSTCSDGININITLNNSLPTSDQPTINLNIEGQNTQNSRGSKNIDINITLGVASSTSGQPAMPPPPYVFEDGADPRDVFGAAAQEPRKLDREMTGICIAISLK